MSFFDFFNNNKILSRLEKKRVKKLTEEIHLNLYREIFIWANQNNISSYTQLATWPGWLKYERKSKEKRPQHPFCFEYDIKTNPMFEDIEGNPNQTYKPCKNCLFKSGNAKGCSNKNVPFYWFLKREGTTENSLFIIRRIEREMNRRNYSFKTFNQYEVIDDENSGYGETGPTGYIEDEDPSGMTGPSGITGPLGPQESFSGIEGPNSWSGDLGIQGPHGIENVPEYDITDPINSLRDVLTRFNNSTANINDVVKTMSEVAKATGSSIEEVSRALNTLMVASMTMEKKEELEKEIREQTTNHKMKMKVKRKIVRRKNEKEKK